MVNIPLFTGFYISQVVQDFFHQQYDLSFNIKFGSFSEGSIPTVNPFGPMRRFRWNEQLVISLQILKAQLLHSMQVVFFSDARSSILRGILICNMILKDAKTEAAYSFYDIFVVTVSMNEYAAEATWRDGNMSSYPCTPLCMKSLRQQTTYSKRQTCNKVNRCFCRKTNTLPRLKDCLF